MTPDTPYSDQKELFPHYLHQTANANKRHQVAEEDTADIAPDKVQKD